MFLSHHYTTKTLPTQTPNQPPREDNDRRQNQPRTRTIHRNDPFICRNCKEPNPKATIGCRNHCRNCLFSVHVDQNVPGDRLSTCLGFMEPIDIDHTAKKGYKVMQKCRGNKKACRKVMWNMVAEDDDLYVVTNLIKLHNERNQKIERRKTPKNRYRNR